MTSDRWDRMMNGSHGMAYGSGLGLMLLAALIFAVVLGLAIYIALRAVDQRPPPSGQAVQPVAPSPRDVLDLRLARGEINPEDYSAARALLVRDVD